MPAATSGRKRRSASGDVLGGIHQGRTLSTWPGRMRFRFWIPLAAPIAVAVVPNLDPIFPSVSPGLTVYVVVGEPPPLELVPPPELLEPPLVLPEFPAGLLFGVV